MAPSRVWKYIAVYKTDDIVADLSRLNQAVYLVFLSLRFFTSLTCVSGATFGAAFDSVSGCLEIRGATEALVFDTLPKQKYTQQLLLYCDWTVTEQCIKDLPSAPYHALKPFRPPDLVLKRTQISLAGELTLLGFWLPQNTTESLLFRTTLKSLNLCLRVLTSTYSSLHAGVLVTSKCESKWIWTRYPMFTLIRHMQVWSGL